MTNQNSLVNFKMLTTNQNGQKSATAYQSPAVFLKKNDIFYLFFDEHRDEGITKCRFEMTTDSLRIRRNGEVVTEQLHVLNMLTDGYIKTSFGHLDTQIVTTRLAFVKQTITSYKLTVKYDFYIEKEKSGTYRLELNIKTKELIS
jgi:uncharacterized beta-barrel protein YwiB (DUF1934 family)